MINKISGFTPNQNQSNSNRPLKSNTAFTSKVIYTANLLNLIDPNQARKIKAFEDKIAGDGLNLSMTLSAPNPGYFFLDDLSVKNLSLSNLKNVYNKIVKEHKIKTKAEKKEAAVQTIKATRLAKVKEILGIK